MAWRAERACFGLAAGALVSLWLVAAHSNVLAQQAPPQDDSAAQAQKLMEELFKGLGKTDAGNNGSPEKGEAKSLEDVIKTLTEGQSGKGADPAGGLLKGLLGGSESGPEACPSFILSTFLQDQLAPAGTQEDRKKYEQLKTYYNEAVLALAKHDIEGNIKVSKAAIALDAEINQWPFAIPRGILLGGFWSNLSAAYLYRTTGDRAESMESAIDAAKKALELLPQEGVCADQRGLSYNNLGSVYHKRIRGEKAENFELAVAAFQAASAKLPRDAYPLAWATTQTNLGASYVDRVRGKASENQEKARQAFLGALEIWTADKYPDAWGSAKNNLAILYLRRITGERAQNIEDAIAALEASLSVRKKDEPAPKPTPNPTPTQTPLNPVGDTGAFLDGLEGLADTLKLLGQSEEGTITVVEPGRWANSQHNLADAYRQRVKGDRADNIERSIAANEASLTYWTQDTDAERWSGAQSDLGEGYMLRVKGERQVNIDRAIEAFNAALKVRTSEAFPRTHLLTAILLGQALSAKGNWVGAMDAFDAARRSFRLLFGQGLNEAEARDLLQNAGPLFTDAAYAAIESGDRQRAFEWLEEGKARLLAVALKLEGLSLDPAGRRRMEELRRQIREGEAAYEIAQGEERAAKIAELSRLRTDLLHLIDAAERRSAPHAGSDLIATAAQALSDRGVLAAPVVSDAGGKLLLVTKTGGRVSLDAVDLPGLTRDRLNALLGARDQGGWLGAYNINYLDARQQTKRLPEWFAAIEDIGAELGRIWGKPLTDALAARGLMPSQGVQLTILPVGPLGLLPLALARHPETGRFLMDDYTVAFAPSLAALVSAKGHAGKARGQPALSAIVNPTGDLPYTALEGLLVASRFAKGKAQTLSENAANSKAVLNALQGRDYWHFSSHGFFDWDEPRGSGLLMAGRKPLTVGDLIDAGGMGSPRLAVLSACETGLYDIVTTPNEFTGLPAAFLQLGAAGVLATLWPVNDLSTALLVARFYDFHLAEKQAPATALRSAQVWLRDATDQVLNDYMSAAVDAGRLPKDLLHALKPSMRSAHDRQRGGDAVAASKRAGKAPFAHPYYWSGFTLTGL